MQLEASQVRGNFNYPTAYRLGAGRVAELPEACRELGIARPLVVTDRPFGRHDCVGTRCVRSSLVQRAAAGLDNARAGTHPRPRDP